jgi:Lysylphosphatidylglycerol synthase TM region
VGLARMVGQFAAGTDSLRELRLWGPMLGWTAVAWAFSIGSGWAGGQAMGRPLGLAELTLLMVLTSAGQAVPSSPGYVGVYHGAAFAALKTFGVDDPKALSIAFVTHAFSYGTLVVSGLVALWLGGYGVRDLMAGVRGRGNIDGEMGRDGAEEAGALQAFTPSTLPVSGTHPPTLPVPPSPAPPVPPSRRA